MPTIITHAAVPLCIGLGLGSRIVPPRLLLTGIFLAMLPDADVLAFKFGVAYGNAFGHRGFTHSLLFAFAVPLLLVFFDGHAAVAQPAGFNHHGRERRWLALAMVR